MGQACVPLAMLDRSPQRPRRCPEQHRAVGGSSMPGAMAAAVTQHKSLIPCQTQANATAGGHFRHSGAGPWTWLGKACSGLEILFLGGSHLLSYCCRCPG